MSTNETPIKKRYICLNDLYKVLFLTADNRIIPDKDIDGFDHTIRVGELKKILSTFPTVNIAEKEIGEWIIDPESNTITCFNCGNKAEKATNYCPECGVKMRDVSSENRRK